MVTVSRPGTGDHQLAYTRGDTGIQHIASAVDINVEIALAITAVFQYRRQVNYLINTMFLDQLTQRRVADIPHIKRKIRIVIRANIHTNNNVFRRQTTSQLAADIPCCTGNQDPPLRRMIHDDSPSV